jgi:hypothetical protein
MSGKAKKSNKRCDAHVATYINAYGNPVSNCPEVGPCSDHDEMHVFLIRGCEWVVAASKADAWDVLREETGTTPEGEGWDREEDVKQEPEDKVISIFADREVSNDMDSYTCAEWVKRFGRGYLCSTEY